MKAKTKRKIKHVLTKKKLVKKRTSRHVMRTAAILLATVSMGSLAYAIAVNKPVVNIAVHSGADGRVLVAPPTPTPKTLSTQDGRASWYALGLAAPDALTCASRTYPRGSYLEVTNTRNGKIVVCRVNDYGPEAWTGRVIDLSRGSFVQIENLSAGVVPVHIRRLSGPTGINIPIVNDVSSLVGYALCNQKHTAAFCELHRMEHD